MQKVRPRICHVGTLTGRNEPVAERYADLGFDFILLDADEWRATDTGGLGVVLDTDIYELKLDHPFVTAHPECFAERTETDIIMDPRRDFKRRGRALARPYVDPAAFVGWWCEQFRGWARSGVKGIRARQPHRGGAEVWKRIIETVRGANPEFFFIAHTPGLTRAEVLALRNCGFDYTVSSLAWWDGRSPWFFEEQEALSRVAPALALVEETGRAYAASCQLRRTRLGLAALTGQGILVPHDYVEAPCEDDDAFDLEACLRTANLIAGKRKSRARSLTGPGAPLTFLATDDGDDCLAAVLNAHEASVIWASNGASFAPHSVLEAIPSFAGDGDKIAPGELRLFRAQRAKHSVQTARDANRTVLAAASAPRVIVTNITPSVDQGAFLVKRIAGESIRVEADVFADGHVSLGCEIVWRYEDERGWQKAPMHAAGNDRWYGIFSPARLGRLRFAVRAWIDAYGSFVHDLAKKRDSGQDIGLDVSEGRLLLEKAAENAPRTIAKVLDDVCAAWDGLDTQRRAALLLAPETAEAVQRTGYKPFETESRSIGVQIDRRQASFASWYELFPRSQTHSAHRHGTFDDVIARLPQISEMGFDVLYLTPIHPIGRSNRKGRNNNRLAGPDDPGSPYAIGSVDGGHDAVHPELGTIDDFRRLVGAARGHGLEIALDFAVQCSPDHPWLKEHPDWFSWRADGSIKYAENPPKKYEDIVNVDFYATGAVPGLWLALRDIVLFWLSEGVKTFRVDNPHTKPFGFWRWLIEDVKGRDPEVIFLSEAFTRPAVMYHLAKLGFTQSYTYFTWRNTKAELAAYLTELNASPIPDFFRPHFFVNTPDINPYFLQTSGRPGFLIRAALATTLSGLWGMSSGFELCEAAALPGREEYSDSEKYEIKPRNWDAPGNIVAEITQLNHIRRSEPALQTHRGVTFYNAFNENILYFGKYAPGYSDRILVAVSLNPHGAEECAFEAPLWEWGLHDGRALRVVDLCTGEHAVWQGKMQHVRLAPDRPFRIWRVSPAPEA